VNSLKIRLSSNTHRDRRLSRKTTNCIRTFKMRMTFPRSHTVKANQLRWKIWTIMQTTLACLITRIIRRRNNLRCSSSIPIQIWTIMQTTLACLITRIISRRNNLRCSSSIPTPSTTNNQFSSRSTLATTAISTSTTSDRRVGQLCR
jgi:hypothetical protein